MLSLCRRSQKIHQLLPWPTRCFLWRFPQRASRGHCQTAGLGRRHRLHRRGQQRCRFVGHIHERCLSRLDQSGWEHCVRYPEDCDFLSMSHWKRLGQERDNDNKTGGQGDLCVCFQLHHLFLNFYFIITELGKHCTYNNESGSRIIWWL